MTRHAAAIGMDFGTEAVRVLVLSLDGTPLAWVTQNYEHGRLRSRPPTRPRADDDTQPPVFIVGSPQDWLEAATLATRQVMRQAPIAPRQIIGVGVAFTRCAMLAAMHNDTPSAGFPRFIQPSPTTATDVDGAAEMFLEAGDWVVWQLIGLPPIRDLQRSIGQAGSASTDSFGGLPPTMANTIRAKLPGRMLSPGQPAGELGAAMAQRLGLAPGTPVSAATLESHANLPGAGIAEPSTLVMVMEPDGCCLLNSRRAGEIAGIAGIPGIPGIPGVATVVEGGILPGYFGYEIRTAELGDALNRLADQHQDGNRALMQAAAFGTRRIVEAVREAGVPVRRFVATGALAHRDPRLMRMYADVLGRKVTVHPSKMVVAQGAAVLGALAAGAKATGFASMSMTLHAMARADERMPGRAPIIYRPQRQAMQEYDRLYADHTPAKPLRDANS